MHGVLTPRIELGSVGDMENETQHRHCTVCDELLKNAETYARVTGSRFATARSIQSSTLTHYGTWYAPDRA